MLQGSIVATALVDYFILALYFACVLGIGWRLRKKVHSSGDFLFSGRAVPVWITSRFHHGAQPAQPARHL